MGMKAYHGHVKSIDDTPFGYTQAHWRKVENGYPLPDS